jgi:oxalate decarboxylase/phosphoglucose isomerase-like protein (cupin superfamily)
MSILEGTNPEACIGGVLFRASRANFPVLQDLSVQSLNLEPGGLREPHSHPNAAQLDYCIEGRARIGIIGPDESVQLLDLERGHISFVPQGGVPAEVRSKMPASAR